MQFTEGKKKKKAKEFSLVQIKVRDFGTVSTKSNMEG